MDQFPLIPVYATFYKVNPKNVAGHGCIRFQRTKFVNSATRTGTFFKAELKKHILELLVPGERITLIDISTLKGKAWFKCIKTTKECDFASTMSLPQLINLNIKHGASIEIIRKPFTRTGE